MEQVRPEIVIDGQTIEVEEGQAIVLPCLVDHLGEIDPKFDSYLSTSSVEEVQVLWSRVDAQRTMIAMGEKVRAPMHCNEEKETRKMLSGDDNIGNREISLSRVP